MDVAGSGVFAARMDPVRAASSALTFAVATHLGRRASGHRVAGGLCRELCSSDELLREFRDLVEVLLDVGQGLAAIAVGLF